MQLPFKALIFDMDGVLINSEQLWRRAMIRGFAEFGMPLSLEDCRKTMGMRFTEVIILWLTHFKITHIRPVQVDMRVTELLLELIEQEGAFIDGIPTIIEFLKKKNIPMGLATSSSHILMNAVLKKLGIEHTLQAKVSAEHLSYAKPHPEVFLECARVLGVSPSQCVVIEDSLNGIIAAKAAQMTVIAVPDEEHTDLRQFALADHRFNTMKEVLPALKELFSR